MSKKGRRNRKAGRRGQAENGYKGVTGMIVQPSIFPPLFKGKMAFSTVASLSPPAGAPSYQTYRLNSVFDPDFTGVGTSAAGYTALAGLYGRYRVLSCKAYLDYVNISATVPLTCFAIMNPATTIGIDVTKMFAERFTWHKSIGTATGSAAVYHVCSARVSALYGVPETQVRNEDDFAAVTGANPNNGLYLHVGAFADAAAAGSLSVFVRLEYEVIWSLPLQNAW